MDCHDCRTQAGIKLRNQIEYSNRWRNTIEICKLFRMEYNFELDTCNFELRIILKIIDHKNDDTCHVHTKTIWQINVIFGNKIFI